MPAHPPADRLAAYGLGRLSDADSTAVEAHLTDCDACRSVVETTPLDPLARLVRDLLPPQPAATAATRTAYRDLRFHARGGLGEVSLARDEAAGRDVAVKRLLPEAATDPARRRRFLREAVVTARLEHPGVAPVYGIGEDESGQPCYAMRFVPGDTLADAIRRLHAAGPPTAAAVRPYLARFTAVCATAAYAHSRGVVHRDIKPSNVAVGPFGETILLDWGLALADDDPADSATAGRAADPGHTATGTVLGTPGYMAPEQEAGTRVGPAADVYSLGVTLRDILSDGGPVPFRPLAAVVAKATHSDPAARYPSPLELAADVDRWLADEPVSAYPDPVAIRLRRWVRRHQSATAAAVALLAVGTIALAVGTVLLGREQRRTADALKSEAEQRATAEAKAAETAAVLGFVDQRVFAAGRPKGKEGGLGRDVKLSEAIAAAVPFVDQGFADQPLTAARLRTTLGMSFSYLGDAKAAEPQFAAARALYETHRGPDAPVTLTALSNLATAYRELGRLDDALKLDEEALARRRAALGPDHPHTLRSMHNLANSYAAVGRDADALRVDEETYARRLATLGADHSDTLMSLRSLASSYSFVDRHADALKLREEVLPVLRAKFGPDHPDTLAALNNLANSYHDLGRHPEALTALEEAVRRMTDTLGPDHRDTLTARSNLARSFAALKRLPEALAVHQEVLARRQAKLSAFHPDEFVSRYNVAVTLLELGRGDEAVAVIDECVRRAAGRRINPQLVPALLERRGKLFAERKDVAGCRATAVMYDELKRTDAASLATAAGLWAACDADAALDRLAKAVAAGFKDAARMDGIEFTALRGRTDFQQLRAKLAK